jgi:hypothetical protein
LIPERILDDSNDDGFLEYLIKWRFQEYSEATWERAMARQNDLLVN